MKRSFLLFPFLLLSCADQSVNRPLIVKVRPVGERLSAVKVALPTAPSDLVVSLSSLPQQIRENNLNLAAARRLVTEAEGRLLQVGLRQNPQLEISFQTSQRFEDFMLTAGLSRTFPRTNRLLLEKRVSSSLVGAARAEVQNAERVLVGRARAALIEVLALRGKHALLKSQQTNAHQFLEFLEKVAAAGETSPLDVGTAKLESKRLENLAKQAAIREFLLIARLKPLFGMKPGGKLQVSGELADPKLPLLNVTSYRRPDVQAAKLRSQSAQEAIALAEARRLGDIEVGIYAGIGRELDEPVGFEGEQTLGFRVKIPLGKDPATSGRLMESLARADRLSTGALALERVARMESNTAYAEMKEWLAMAQQIKNTLLPLVDEQITNTEEARKLGQVALREVLLARDQKLSLEMSYLEAVRDFHLAHAKYLTAIAQ